MTDKHTAAHLNGSDTDAAAFGMAQGPPGAQRVNLRALSEASKVDSDDTPAKAQASYRIEDVSRLVGRGKQVGESSGQQLDTAQSMAGEEDPGSALELIARGT